jgi:hypothetical protein
MGRLVKIQPSGNETAGLNTTAGSSTDTQTYMEQVVKYIPAEIIGGYVAINGFLASIPAQMLNTALWINFAFCAVLTVVYLVKLSEPGDATKTQLVISFFSFIIWAYSITGDSGVFGKGGINIYYSQIASVLLVAFSLLTPLFTPKAAN